MLGKNNRAKDEILDKKFIKNKHDLDFHCFPILVISLVLSQVSFHSSIVPLGLAIYT